MDLIILVADPEILGISCSASYARFTVSLYNGYNNSLLLFHEMSHTISALAQIWIIWIWIINGSM